LEDYYPVLLVVSIIRRWLYQAIVVNLGLWEVKDGHWKKKIDPNWKRFTVSAGCAAGRGCGIYKRSGSRTKKVRRTAANSVTMESMMEVRKC
jgi:hypothetical protein